MFLTYVLSFVYLGIYWNNHHHMLHAAARVSGGVLWANLHLLFWLSLIPFVTGVDGRAPLRRRSRPPSTASCCLAPRSRTTSCRPCCSAPKARTPCSRAALGRDVKGKISPLLYCLGIGLSFVNRWIALALYVAVALMWLVPDRRIERHVSTASAKPTE